MTNLSIAADAQFDDREGFLDFLGTHEIAHRCITAALQTLGFTVTQSLPVLPGARVSPDWMLAHYQVHTEIGADIGQTVPDLSGYDLDNADQYADWMNVHGQLHEQINAALGIVT